MGTFAYLLSVHICNIKLIYMRTYIASAHGHRVVYMLFGLVAFPFFLFIEKSFHVITQLGVWCRWWFNYPGPLLEVELESACLSGQGCGLCIALIRPNHWAASVAQWLEHLSSKQCVVGSNPTRAALFLFGEKRVVWVSCLSLFSIYRKEFSCSGRIHAHAYLLCTPGMNVHNYTV